MSYVITQTPGSTDTRCGLSLHETIASLPIAALYAKLESRPAGLTQAEAALRLERCGPNAIREVKGTPLIFKFLANFTHVMALLLWIGGVVAFIAQLPQLARLAALIGRTVY